MIIIVLFLHTGLTNLIVANPDDILKSPSSTNSPHHPEEKQIVLEDATSPAAGYPPRLQYNEESGLPPSSPPGFPHRIHNNQRVTADPYRSPTPMRVTTTNNNFECYSESEDEYLEIKSKINRRKRGYEDMVEGTMIKQEPRQKKRKTAAHAQKAEMDDSDDEIEILNDPVTERRGMINCFNIFL